jgi:geranylgeranyl pyrophosphate synthase
MTLPLILLRERVTAQDHRLLSAVILGESQRPQDYQRIRDLLMETSAHADALRRARDHGETALEAIRMALPNRDLETLEAIAAFVLARAL